MINNRLHQLLCNTSFNKKLFKDIKRGDLVTVNLTDIIVCGESLGVSDNEQMTYEALTDCRYERDDVWSFYTKDLCRNYLKHNIIR